MSAHLTTAEPDEGGTRFNAPAGAIHTLPFDAVPFDAVLEERSVARGVVLALIISLPFWSLLGFALYLLL